MVEERLNGGDARGAGRNPRRPDLRPMRNPQARPDQQELARVEMVQARELRNGRVVLTGEPRKRVARTHDVDGGQRALRLRGLVMLCVNLGGDGTRERHGVALDERRERVRPDDAVAAQVEALLHDTHAVQGRPVEVRVHGNADPLADEQELEHGYVPAERSAVQCPRPKERTSERPEGLARARVREPGDGQPVDPLEGTNGSHGPRSGEGVDRAAVEPLSPQRHLQAGGLRVPARGERPRDGGHGGGRDDSEQKDAQTHGVPEYAPPAPNPPVRWAD
jgi:hypothetical protein